MADERVQMIYEAVVRGQEKLEALVRENEKLNTQNEEQKAKVERLTKEHEKHQGILLRSRSAVQALRREMFIFGFVAGSVIGTLRLLSSGSDELAERLENIGTAFKRLASPVGNFIARNLLGGKGDMSKGNQIKLSGMFSDIESLKGNDYAALVERIRGEEIKAMQEAGDKWDSVFKRVFDKRKALLLENQRLEELGLERLERIRSNFRKDLVTGAQGSTGDVLFKMFQGEKQGMEEIINSFRTGLNRALADALSKSLFTSLFQGGNPFQNFMDVLTGKQKNPEQQKTNQILERIEKTNARIADCSCYSAEGIAELQRVSGMVPTSATYQPPKVSNLQKAASILNLFSAVGGGFGGGGGGGNPAPPGGPILTIPGQVPAGHSGGMFGRRSFASGGEVPASLMEGEFVVRRPAAQRNKGLLKDINGGATATPGGGGSVFLIKTNDAQSFSQMLSSPSSRNAIEIQLMRAIMENSSVRDVIKTFGR